MEVIIDDIQQLEAEITQSSPIQAEVNSQSPINVDFEATTQWGFIGGTLSNQADLMEELDNIRKLAYAGL